MGHTLIEGVDLWDGHLTLSREDLSYPGRGVALAFERTYSSNASQEPGKLGQGWSHNYESQITVTPCGEVIVMGGDGSGQRFVDDGAGGLRPLKGYHGTLLANPEDQSFDFYAKSGNRFHYEAAGDKHWRLSRIEDPNGNVTSLTYAIDGQGEELVTAVIDSAGRALRFTYELRQFALWAGSVVTSVSGPDRLSVKFTFDDFGYLLSARREADARVELYEYAEQPGSSFEARRQALVTVTDGLNGATTRYTYGTWELASAKG